ncbi:MAG: HlyD family efflux transporter periplasmic adaptor subunit [Phycisphaerales bacterium]|nr:HlyD family efflux transporter periplasmic adaptor subunit [Phycisphaerales bacterium]
MAAIALGGAAWMLSGVKSASKAIGPADLHVVERGTFEVTIPASGNLIAQNQVEIRNALDGSASITEIVPEGTAVRTGDVLLRLDDLEVLERIADSRESLIKAQADVEADEAALEIAQKSAESSVSAAQVNVEQAELALLAWQDGEVVSTRNSLALAVQTAEKDHKRLADKYEKSKQLRERDFISQNDLEQDEIAMIRAAAALSKARLDQEVYEKYTFQKDQLAVQSAKTQAVEELERVEKRTAAQVRSATTKLEASRANEEAKQTRLDRYEEQLKATTIFAPSDGMVVYGSTMQRDRRGENESAFRVGSKVSRNQLLIVLPDTSRMAADVKVNEALSGLVEHGQPSVIRTDALPDQIFDGAVHSVGVLAEDGGWRDPNRRDYSVRIDLDDIGEDQLKPSMRCTAQILVDTVADVLFVPVHAIHRRGRLTYVLKRDGDLYDETVVTLGRASERYVEITSGLAVGDSVLLVNPPPGSLRSHLDDQVSQ